MVVITLAVLLLVYSSLTLNGQVESIQRGLIHSQRALKLENKVDSEIKNLSAKPAPSTSLLIQNDLKEILSLTPEDQFEIRERITRFRSEIAALDGTPRQRIEPLSMRFLDIQRANAFDRNQRNVTLITSTQASLTQIVIIQAALLIFLLAVFILTWMRIFTPIFKIMNQVSESLSPEHIPGLHPSNEGVARISFKRDIQKMTDHLNQKTQDDQLAQDQVEREVDSRVRDLLKQQEDLLQIGKLSIASELAASLAHDIRNPLAAIQMSLSNLRADIQEEEISERIERISSEVLRMGRIVGDVVESARVEVEPDTNLKLADLVSGILQLARYQTHSGISIQNYVSEELNCRLPQESVRQALFSLITNSIQAMGDTSGVIKIEAEVIDSDLKIVVKDSGPGFPEEILQAGGRAFQSGSAENTGLGLASVRRLMRDHGGSMKLSNYSDLPLEIHQSACVALLLPSCVDDV